MSGQRRPSPELSLDGASPALPGGTRSSALPWLNGPALYVAYDSPYFDPEAHSGGQKKRLLLDFVFVLFRPFWNDVI